MEMEKDSWDPTRVPSSIEMCEAGGGSLGSHQGAQLCREGCSWRGVTELVGCPAPWGHGVPILGHSRTPEHEDFQVVSRQWLWDPLEPFAPQPIPPLSQRLDWRHPGVIPVLHPCDAPSCIWHMALQGVCHG